MQKSMQKGSQGRKRLTQGSGKESRKEGIWLSPEGKISVCQIERHVMGGVVYVTLRRTEVGAGSDGLSA